MSDELKNQIVQLVADWLLELQAVNPVEYETMIESFIPRSEREKAKNNSSN